MAKGRNTLRLDTSGFERMLAELDAMGGNVQKVTEQALEKASAKISQDTLAAMAKPNLPRQGKYSTGTTLDSVIREARVEWEGLVGAVPVGFDFSKPGAGGYLISGTPRMRPNKALNAMYKRKKYMNEIQTEISNVIFDAMQKEWNKK